MQGIGAIESAPNARNRHPPSKTTRRGRSSVLSDNGLSLAPRYKPVAHDR